MTEKFDPIIEAALIQAAAALAVEASGLAERNLRAKSNMAGPHGLPIIDQTADRADPLQNVVSVFRNALVEVREEYRDHLKAPRLSAYPQDQG